MMMIVHSLTLSHKTGATKKGLWEKWDWNIGDTCLDEEVEEYDLVELALIIKIANNPELESEEQFGENHRPKDLDNDDYIYCGINVPSKDH